MISKCNKLVQKEYKIRHDWVGWVISREFRKKLKFDYSPQMYVCKPESLLENKTPKNLWGIEI